MIAHTGNPPRPPFQTIGINAYIGAGGQGLPKRYSTAHHAEMMFNIITHAGARSFV